MKLFKEDEIIKFLEQHDDYQNYESTKYFTDEIPKSFIDSFQGYIRGQIQNSGDYKNIISIVAKHVPCNPEFNWNFPWLYEDLDNALRSLHKKGKFYKTMDCIGEIVGSYFKDSIEEINEIFEDELIGYVLIYDIYDGALWTIREDIEYRTKTVSEVLEVLAPSFENTIQHLEQAQLQLARMENPRARKDALRDCVSALEAHLKYLSGEDHFRNAVNILVERERGNKKILREALSIWSYVHDDVPEIRHGHTSNVSVDIAEILYYIDKISAIIKYLNRVFSI